MIHDAMTRPPTRWAWLFGLAALVLLLTAVLSRPNATPNHAALPVAGEKIKDPLVELNDRFRAAYAHARKDLLAHQGPVIIADGDELVLLRRGQRTAVNVTPASYHVVKAVSHVPLAVHVLLATAGEVELPAVRQKELRGLREPLDSALKSLGDRALPQDVLKVQTQILQETTKFLDAVLADKKVKAEARLAFTRKLGPLLLTSARHAATVQLNGMHKQVMAWKAEMTEGEWKQLRVLILGSALPRKDNLRTQYFARLLAQKDEGGRIIYTEGLFEESRALNLLGTYQLDAAIGAAFFDDSARMHRDLLADAAAAHLKTMSFDLP
jgi:hypothetical protein